MVYSRKNTHVAVQAASFIFVPISMNISPWTCFPCLPRHIARQRIKPILDSIISQNQSAFVARRSISDNVFIAHEYFHYLKTGKKVNFIAWLSNSTSTICSTNHVMYDI